MTHQEALTCAAKMAGLLKPARTVSLRLVPKSESVLTTKSMAQGDVVIDAYDLDPMQLVRLEEQINSIGYSATLEGGYFGVDIKTGGAR